MKEYPIFPEINKRTSENEHGCTYTLKSTIRIKHRNKYYLSPIANSWYYKKNEHQLNILIGKEESLQRFSKLIYESIILTKITKPFIQQGIFTLDTNQQAEQERLSKMPHHFDKSGI